MKTVFISKPSTLEEVKMRLERTTTQEAYKIGATKRLSETEWNALVESLLSDRDWISEFNRKLKENPRTNWSKRNCIKVTCEGKSESLLIDPQGYDYARYTAIMEG